MDLFEEIKAAAWQQKNRNGDPRAITAYQVLRMATAEGAKALGLEKEIGTLEVGKKADMILIDLEKPHLYPHNDYCALLAYAVNGGDVDTTIVNGQVLMENRRLRTLDEREVLKQAETRARRIMD